MTVAPLSFRPRRACAALLVGLAAVLGTAACGGVSDEDERRRDVVLSDIAPYTSEASYQAPTARLFFGVGGLEDAELHTTLPTRRPELTEAELCQAGVEILAAAGWRVESCTSFGDYGQSWEASARKDYPGFTARGVVTAEPPYRQRSPLAPGAVELEINFPGEEDAHPDDPMR